MGKLIICSGKQATRPYEIKLTNTKIYSIEELCYYLYENIDVINEDFFDEELPVWMAEELELTERAQKLQELILNHTGIKDLVVFILCSSDYYTEVEIKQLLKTIDELLKLTPMERMKKKADNFLKYRQFTQAANEYESILNSKEAAALTSDEYGNLIHNLAVVQVNTIGAGAAADKFKEAYERNHNTESLKQYLYALDLSKQDEIYQRVIREYQVSEEIQTEIRDNIDQTLLEVEKEDSYQIVNDLKDYRQAGKINMYYQAAGNQISNWKLEFRRENT